MRSTAPGLPTPTGTRRAWASTTRAFGNPGRVNLRTTNISIARPVFTCWAPTRKKIPWCSAAASMPTWASRRPTCPSSRFHRCRVLPSAGSRTASSNEETLYVAPVAALDGAKTPWKKLADVPDAVTYFDFHGDTLYLLTHRDASKFKVLQVDMNDPDLAKARVMIPPGDTVITHVGVARDALYVQTLDGGLSRLGRIPFEGEQAGKMLPLPLPFEGAVNALAADPLAPGIAFSLEGWVHSEAILAFAPVTAKTSDTGLAPPSTVDFLRLRIPRIQDPVGRRRANPAFADRKKEPTPEWRCPDATGRLRSQWGQRLPGLHAPDAGVVGNAVGSSRSPTCGVAGSWARIGISPARKLHKENSVRDFITAGQWLVDKKYTSPARLGGKGDRRGRHRGGRRSHAAAGTFRRDHQRRGLAQHAARGVFAHRSGEHPGIRHGAGAGTVSRRSLRSMPTMP